ncbi:MAG: hypothetical protein M1831_007530 [Alyxoria varia]|nr:MAG: hypothetical protein M1831_007530 [Alyxoria varia]
MPPSGIHLEARAKLEKRASHAGQIIGGVIVFILLVLLVVALYWLYRTYQARRLGLAPPSINPFARQSNVNTRNYPARGGLMGWIENKLGGLRGANRGAYSSGGRSRGGFGPLDPDEAWDARVGNEADEYAAGGTGGYYEEQELGLRHGQQDSSDVGPYSGGGYGPTSRGYGPGGPPLQEMDARPDGRGRSRSRDPLEERYNQEMGRGGGRTKDPFGDGAEPSTLSVRGRSPVPEIDTHGSHSRNSKDDSPTERRSIFREQV